MKSTVQAAAVAPNRLLRRFDLNSPLAISLACTVVPLVFGFYSLWLGADANWDLQNYHLYSPFAWLHGKLLTDLAPAGAVTYFNPLLDVFWFNLNAYFPSRVAGFLMGALHGLTFVLLVAIARHVWPTLPDDDRYRLPILLAAAGCLTGNFLSGLGNSMGDDTTALLILAGLLVALTNWERLGSLSLPAIAAVLGSGLVVGLGVGLKLTNGVYAAALCLSLLIYPSTFFVRLRTSFLFGIGVLAGFAITGGYWMFHMWRLFGNPLYPQFSGIFSNPMTRSGGIVTDVDYLPHGLFEALFWPFIITANSHRVGEVTIHQIIWALVYVALCCVIVVFIKRRLARVRERVFDPRQSFVILFVCIGFVFWMKLFGVYRYIVPIEVLAPMVLLLALQYLMPERRARRTAVILLAIASAFVCALGARTLGHEEWADPLYHAQLPPLSEPERTTVIMYGGRSAWAWIATRFPDTVAFTQLESGPPHVDFPASDAFRERMRAMPRERGGPAFGLITGSSTDFFDARVARMESANNFLSRFGINKNQKLCDGIRRVVLYLGSHANVIEGQEPGEKCKLEAWTSDRPPANRMFAADAVPIFQRNGFDLDIDSCVPYEARIGKGVQVYQWCRLSVR